MLVNCKIEFDGLDPWTYSYHTIVNVIIIDNTKKGLSVPH
jgi:hypothetical protein